MPIKYLIDDSLFSGSVDTLRTSIGGFYNPPLKLSPGESPTDYYFDVETDPGGMPDDYGVEGVSADDYTISRPRSERISYALSRTGDSTGESTPILTTTSNDTLMINRTFTVRLIGSEDTVFSDEHWKTIIAGGSWGNEQIPGILKDNVVFDDLHTESIYPIDNKKVKRLKELNINPESWSALYETQGDFVTISPEINYYVPYYQAHTDNLKSELTIPNAYIMGSMIFFGFDMGWSSPKRYAAYRPNYWNYDIIRSVAREKVDHFVNYTDVNSSELFYDFGAGAPGYVSPYDSLLSDMEPSSDPAQRLKTRYSYMATKYLPITIPTTPLSSSTAGTLENKLQNIFFDQYCGEGYDNSSGGMTDHFNGILNMVPQAFKTYYPYYFNIKFYTERAKLFTNRINFHSYSSRFLKTLKEVFLDEIELKPKITSFECAYNNVEPSYTTDDVYEEYIREQKGVKTVDFLEMILYTYNNYKSETNNCFFAGSPIHNPESIADMKGFAKFQRKSAMDETGDFRYFNTISSYDLLNTTLQLFGYDSSSEPEDHVTTIDELFNVSGDFLKSEFLRDPDGDPATPETYGESGDLRGLKSRIDGGTTHAVESSIFGYNEVVAYRVEKVASDSTGEDLNIRPIQNFWFINTEDRKSLNFIDTQVKYDKNYTYNIYSYTISVGVKYKTTGAAITKYTSDVADPDTGLPTELNCLEFFDPNTGEPTAELFGHLDESELLGEMSATGADGVTTYFLSRASVRTKARYMADFHLHYEPTIKLIENKIYSKTLKVLDHPANKVDAEPFQLLDQSQTIGFRLSYDAYIPKEFPQTISRQDVKLKEEYMHSYDFLEGEAIGVTEVEGAGSGLEIGSHGARKYESKSRPRYLEVYRLSEKPTKYEDFENNLYSTIDLKVLNKKTSTYADQTVESEFFYDKIEYNKKYYYIFRVLSEQKMIGHVSEVYEAELVYDGASPYAVFNTFYKSDLKEKVFTNPSKQFKKLLQIRPNLQQIDFIDDTVDYGDRAIEQIDNIEVGKSSDSIWEFNRFKLRLTSKKTNKKIDINLTFNLDSD